MTPEQRERIRKHQEEKYGRKPPTPKPTKAPKKSPSESRETEPPPRSPDDVEVHYDAEKKNFWAMNATGEWQELTKASLGLILRASFFSPHDRSTDTLSALERKFMHVIQHNNVHYAGRVSGWQTGLHTICGNRVLVTRGPKLPTPKRGPFPLIRQFIHDLLGSQSKFFYGWMKHAYLSLAKGAPFAPGQMLAVAGPVACGKSVLQNLITEMLGGRAAKPYRYMSGQTAFNGDLIEAEHLMIEDDVEGRDLRTRRHFGAMIKTTCVNRDQSAHCKGRPAFSIQPFWRLTMTLNDEAERLMLLPPLDGDVRDKIILLKANKVKLPYPSRKLPDYHAYFAALKAEVPAFLDAMRRWSIPPTIADERFGVATYHDPELVARVAALSPEGKMWSIILESGMLDEYREGWLGSSEDVEKILLASSLSAQVRDLLHYPTACGVYLSRLRVSMPDHVTSHPVGKNRQEWCLKK